MGTNKREPERVIVVGVDGSASADRALGWAAAVASRTAAGLRIVSVWDLPFTDWTFTTVGYIDPTDIEAGAKHIVDQARESVTRKMGSAAPAMETVVVTGPVAGQLIGTSADAALLVVGTSGRGELLSVALGSVAVTCAHHSSVPLAVVGSQVPEPGSAEIAVGFDDSPGARQALRWALGEATRLGVALRVVHGFDMGKKRSQSDSAAEVDLVGAAQIFLDRTIADELANHENPPQVTAIAVPTAAVDALVAEARSAGMLVVGSRGRGGFTGLLLGSVSRKCLRQSPCPLVIVPTIH